MPENSNLPNVNVMSKAARQVSRRLMRDFAEIEHLLSSVRGTSDFAARSWAAAESALVDSLQESRPYYGVKSEGLDRQGKDPTRRWILEALDGKFNFSRGLAHWAISVALEHKGEIVAAVVLDPLRNEEFHSIKGSGSRMNKMRLRTSSCSSIGTMLVAADRISTDNDDGGNPDRFANVYGRVGGIRVSGATSLDLAYLAAGRFDGFLGHSCTQPQFAAASLIAREAGVLFEHLDDRESASESFSAIAGCGRIFEKFLELAKTIQHTQGGSSPDRKSEN